MELSQPFNASCFSVYNIGERARGQGCVDTIHVHDCTCRTYYDLSHVFLSLVLYIRRRIKFPEVGLAHGKALTTSVALMGMASSYH